MDKKRTLTEGHIRGGKSGLTMDGSIKGGVSKPATGENKPKGAPPAPKDTSPRKSK